MKNGGKKSVALKIWVSVCVCVCVYIYIYTYTYRPQFNSSLSCSIFSNPKLSVVSLQACPTVCDESTPLRVGHGKLWCQCHHGCIAQSGARCCLVGQTQASVTTTPCHLINHVMIIKSDFNFSISLVCCRSVQNLCLDKIQGFILNVPSRVSLGIVSLPLRRRHWLAVRDVNGQFYNLDSKLKRPACIGGGTELRWDLLLITYKCFFYYYLINGTN